MLVFKFLRISAARKTFSLILCYCRLSFGSAVVASTTPTCHCRNAVDRRFVRSFRFINRNNSVPMLASAALSASRCLSRPGLSALCRRSAAPAASASASAFASRPMSTDGLPYHLVMGMPALSPTMESGSIASWSLAEGDAFSAGDSLAEIETDKATMAFEAQDDGYIAKILVEAGNGDDVSVNTPIVVVVEEVLELRLED